MSYGLQVRDGANNIILTITDRLTRFIAEYIVTVPTRSTITVSIPGITPDGTWFVYYIEPQIGLQISTGFVTLNNPFSSTTTRLLVFRC